jgi:hypothetical protein
MGLTDLIFKKTKASIQVVDPTTSIAVGGALTFDASVSETHIDEAEITSHPVEGGGDVSDHIRKLPVSLEINGVITQEIMDNGDVVEVVTSLRTYSNMAITAVSVLRDAQNGNILNCTVSLREIIIAGSVSVDLPLPNDSANKAAKNQGKKDTTNGSSKQDQKSFAAKAVGL